MKKFVGVLSLVLFGFSVSTLAAQPTQIWAIGVTGGLNAKDTGASFYREAREFHSDLSKFGIPASRSYEFFGMENGLKCVQGYDFQYKGANYNTLDLFREYAHSPSCTSSVVDPIVADLSTQSQIICNRAPSASEIEKQPALRSGIRVDPRLEYLDGPDPLSKKGIGPRGQFVPATSSLVGFLGSVQKVEKAASRSKADRHLLLFLNDHGTVSMDGANLNFGFGNGDQLQETELNHVTKQLAKDGVQVHLVVDACYSGLLNRLSQIDSSGGGVCTVVNADSSTAATTLPGAKDWPQALGEYGDQLEALGCLNGDNSLNRYTSGLDEVVRGWEETQENFRWPDCSEVTSFKDLRAFVQSTKRVLSSRATVQQERQELIAAYLKDYVRPMRDCMKASSHMYDRAFTWLSNCSEKLGETELSSFIDGVNHSYAHSAETVARHLHFLRNAPPEQLRRFKQVFCCLGFNFKTLEYPKICGSGNS